jgi:DNA-binding transcriptional MerR regulator
MEAIELLTVDELAQAAGTTARTVRAYQTRGLLPAPRKIGRIAYYGPEHLVRLQLIERLLSRGFLLSAIGDLLRASEQGSGLAGVLGHPALQRLQGPPGAPAQDPEPARLDEPAPPAVERAEALREQVASISERFGDLLARQAWKAAIEEIRASEREGVEGDGPAVPLDTLDQVGALQQELADVSDQFVDLLRRQAWRTAVAEIRDASDGD